MRKKTIKDVDTQLSVSTFCRESLEHMIGGTGPNPGDPPPPPPDNIPPYSTLLFLDPKGP